MIETQTKKQVIPGVFDYVFKELVTDESCRKWLAEIISEDDFFIGMWDYEEDRKKIERSKIKGAERKGFAGGLEQGKITTALNMLNKNLDISLIAECTGLSIESISALNNEQIKNS